MDYLQMIDSGEELSERQLRDFVFSYEVDRIEGSPRRWTSTITSYCQVGDRYFEVEWEEGLTECQDNMFDNQPIEVGKVITEIIVPEQVIPEHIQITESWVRI